MVRPRVARGFVNLADAVLHQCIRPLIGACAPGHHGYQRACDLITGQASNGAIWVTSVRMRREDRSSIVVSSSRRPRRGKLSYVIDSSSSCLRCSFVRAWRPFLRPDLRATDAPRAGGRQGWPSRRPGLSRPCCQATPCMRPFKSSPISQHSSLSSSQFLCSTWNPVSSPRPTRVEADAHRACQGRPSLFPGRTPGRFQAAP